MKKPSDPLMEQLQCVVQHYPLWPGDTLTHDLAYECARRGWIVRNKDGSWIPTALGVRVYDSREAAKEKR